MIWTMPAGRMKGGKEHRVPLSEHAIALLRELPTEEGNPHVFIGPSLGAGLSNMAMTSVLRRMGHGDITVHGIRSTFRDWAAERTNYRTTSSRWRWLTWSATRSKPPIGAETCWPSATTR